MRGRVRGGVGGDVTVRVRGGVGGHVTGRV